MNILLVCPHCNSAISRATPICLTCGEVTGHGRSRACVEGSYQPTSQSVITIVIDALRTRPGRHRQTTQPIAEAVSDS